MISYIQLEKFFINNQNNSKIDLVNKAFLNYVNKEQIIVEDILNKNFYNGKIDDTKVITILYFNMFLENQPKIKQAIENYQSCTEYFYKSLNNKNGNLFNILKNSLMEFLSYIKLNNKFIYNEILNLLQETNSNFLDKKWNNYYIYLEDFLIVKHNEIYFEEVIDLKQMYLDFLDYLKDIYKDNTKNIELNDKDLNFLKKDNIIINKYKDCLFKGLTFDNIVENFREQNNNLLIFDAMKQKYFEDFLAEEYSTYDNNIYYDYFKSELFKSVTILYSLYRSK